MYENARFYLLLSYFFTLVKINLMNKKLYLLKKTINQSDLTHVMMNICLLCMLNLKKKD